MQFYPQLDPTLRRAAPVAGNEEPVGLRQAQGRARVALRREDLAPDDEFADGGAGRRQAFRLLDQGESLAGLSLPEPGTSHHLDEGTQCF